MPTQRKNWSREETILALYLYCQIPFSKIDKHNPEIIKLANLIGRTPGSVSSKLANLGHFDPSNIKRNVNGLSHTSKLDEKIVSEFLGHWYSLNKEAIDILSAYQNANDTLPFITSFYDYSTPEQQYNACQLFFNNSVKAAYGYSCCVTGIKYPPLLKASYIKPIVVSDPINERYNPTNGICMNSIHAIAFQKGLITIDPSTMKLIYSPRLHTVEMDDNTKNWLFCYEGYPISNPEKFQPDKAFLKYHNNQIFIH